MEADEEEEDDDDEEEEEERKEEEKEEEEGPKILRSTLCSCTFNLRAYFSFGRRTNTEQHVSVYFLYRAILFCSHNHLYLSVVSLILFT